MILLVMKIGHLCDSKTLFFGTGNVRIQAMMTGVLSFLVFSGLLVITARRACGRWSNLALV